MGTTLRGIVTAEADLVLTSEDVPVGPLPGSVAEVADQTSRLVLEASGSITSDDSPALDLRIARAGLPGNAQILWRDTATGGTWYGWDALHVAHALRQLASTGDSYRPSCAIRLASGGWLAAVSRDDRAVDVVGSAVGLAPVEVYDRGSAFAAGRPEAALVQLPSGRVLLFHWLYRAAGLQIRAWRSDDEGVSWDLHQTTCLPAPLATATYEPRRIRVARIGSSLLLVAHVVHSAPEDRLIQYASEDEGASWTEIAELGSVARGWPEILVSGGRAVVVYLAYRAASTPNVLPYVRVLASAYEPLDEAEAAAAVDVTGWEWGSYSGGQIVNAELTGIVEQGGALLLAGINLTGGGTREIHTARSSDGGGSWAACGASTWAPVAAGTLWAGGSASIYPASLVLAGVEGGAWLLHRWQGGADPDGLYALETGGWRPVTLPAPDEGADGVGDQTSWTRTWLPAAEPDALDAATWTQATGGAPAVAVDGAGLEITVGGAGDSVNWSATPTTSTASGLTVEADVTPSTGHPFVDLRVSGASRYSVRAHWIAGTETWTLRDLIAGADLGSVACAGSTATRHRLLIGLDEDSAWLQVVEVLDEGDGAEIGTAEGVPTSGAASSDVVQFGVLSGGAAGDVSTFHGIAWADGDDTGAGLSGGQGVGSRQGRPIGAEPVWITRGLHLRALDGPASRAEEWTVAARYSYPTSAADPFTARSSRIPARWAGVPELVWTWADGLPRMPMAVPCIYLERFNFKRAQVEYQDTGGAWQSLGTLDLYSDSGLGWTRSGSAIIAASTGAASRRFAAEELTGGYFVEAVALGSDRWWPIIRQEGGRWLDAAGGGQRARLTVSGALSGDPASGTAGLIIPPRVLIALPPSLLSTPFQAIRLSPGFTDAAASDPDSGEDYWQIGIALIGTLHPFGRQYGPGRVSEVASQGDVLRGLSGVVLSARRRGRPLRAVEFAWNDAQDEYPLGLDSIPEESVYGVPVSTPAAALPDLAGWLTRIGVDVPVVYVAALELESGTVPTVHHAAPDDLLYGIAETETHRRDTVLGDEGAEARRGGTLRIAEVG